MLQVKNDPIATSKIDFINIRLLELYQDIDFKKKVAEDIEWTLMLTKNNYKKTINANN